MCSMPGKHFQGVSFIVGIESSGHRALSQVSTARETPKMLEEIQAKNLQKQTYKY